MRDITEEVSKATSVPPSLWKVEKMMKDAGGYKDKHMREKSRMNVKKDYIVKTKEYLTILETKISKIDILKHEIDMLKKNKAKYSSIDISQLGFKSNKSYKGIEDLIINNEDKIFIKETEIEIIESKRDTMDLYLTKLTDVERKVIELRYLKKNKDNSTYSFTDIARKLNYSNITIKRKNDIAIKKIAYFLYGEEALY